VVGCEEGLEAEEDVEEGVEEVEEDVEEDIEEDVEEDVEEAVEEVEELAGVEEFEGIKEFAGIEEPMGAKEPTGVKEPTGAMGEGTVGCEVWLMAGYLLFCEFVSLVVSERLFFLKGARDKSREDTLRLLFFPLLSFLSPFLSLPLSSLSES
jgi:hypothetical protein